MRPPGALLLAALRVGRSTSDHRRRAGARVGESGEQATVQAFRAIAQLLEATDTEGGRLDVVRGLRGEVHVADSSRRLPLRTRLADLLRPH